MKQSRLGRIWLQLVVIVCSIYFLVPLLSMARFSFQRIQVFNLTWGKVFEGWTFESIGRVLDEKTFGPALWTSVRLAILTVILTFVLMLPTALWAHLRTPNWRPVVEFVTVLPYVIPPIAMVVGAIGTYRDAVPWFISSPYCLVPFYAVLAMPFTYRSLDAGLRSIPLATLTDASRSLGAGWWTTIVRVIVPNVRAALIGSAFLTITVCLGEFTIANLLLKKTLPIFNNEFQRRDGPAGTALGLVTLFLISLLLTLISSVTRRRRGTDVASPIPTAGGAVQPV